MVSGFKIRITGAAQPASSGGLTEHNGGEGRSGGRSTEATDWVFAWFLGTREQERSKIKDSGPSC